MEKKVEGLVKAMLANLEEAGAMIEFVAAVALAGGDDGRGGVEAGSTWPEQGSPLSLQLLIAAARAVFTASFFNSELCKIVEAPALKQLAAISARSSIVMSCILEWTRENFIRMPQTAGRLFDALPLQTWHTSARDLELVLNMLKDPIGSPKFVLAQKIVERLNWDVANIDTHELFLPRSHHRLVALTLANICLDRQSLRDSRAGIISGGMAIASKGLATVGPYALPNSLSYLYVDEEKRFFEWCWTMILKMNLYHGPITGDSYTLDTFASEEKPFEPLATPALATLRGAMRSHAMAAYVVLMVSEIGHHYHMFKTEGWYLLRVIKEDGRSGAALRSAVELFPTFAKMYGVGCLDEEEFGRFFSGFFKGGFQEMEGKGGEGEDGQQQDGGTRKGGVISFLRPLIPSDLRPIDDVVLRFWLKALFANEFWNFNPVAISFLDSICQICFAHGQMAVISNALQAEYGRMLDCFQTEGKAPLRLQITHPIATSYSVASAVKPMFQGYPTLVVGSRSWLEASAWKGPTAENERSWYAFSALTAETEAEEDVRRMIGEAMSRNPQATISVAAVGTGKPVAMFAIYRWAQHLLELPLDHPLLPLFWRAFFSLYFQRTEGSVPLNTCFGFRFFLDRRETLDALERRLGQCSQFYAERMVGDMRGRGGPNVDQLSQLYNAMALWLREPRLASPDMFVDSLGERYYVERLKQCMSGRTPVSFSAAWLDLVPMSALREGFVNVKTVTSATTANAGAPLEDSTSVVLASVVRPPPTFVPRQPLAQSLATFTIKLASSIFDQDLTVVLSKSRSFDRLVAEHMKVDEDYTSNLSRLYANELKRGRAEKGCSTKCAGRAIFDFRVQEVQSVGEVKSFLSENRTHAEVLMGTDHMDPKICISALKVMRAMDWLCSGGRGDEESGKRKVATQVFYRTVATLSASAKEFPPAGLVLDRLVRSLGLEYVAGSAEETEKVFELMNSQERIGLLVDVFRPEVAVDAFERMYVKVADMVGSFDEAVVASLLRQFDMRGWMGNSPKPSAGTQLSFARVVLNRLPDVEAGAILDAQLEIVRELMALLPVETYTEAIEEGVLRVMKREVHPRVFEVLVRSLNAGEPVRRSILDTTELILNRLTRERALSLVQSITKIVVAFCDDDVPVYSNGAKYFESFVDLVITIFASSSVYTMSSEIHLKEVWAALRDLILPFLGVVRQAAGCKIVPITQSTPLVQQFVQVSCRLVGKMCRHAVIANNLCAHLWEIYAIVVKRGGADAILGVLHNVLRQQAWTGMHLGWDVVHQMLGWAEKGRMGVEIQRFVCFVLEAAQWKMEYRAGQYWMDAIHLVFFVVGRGMEVYGDGEARLKFLNGVGGKCFGGVDWSNFTPIQFGEVVQRLPEDWSPAEEASTLQSAESKTKASPLLFTLECLRSMAGISKDVQRLDTNDLESTYSKLEQYVDYVLGLLSRQTSVARIDTLAKPCRTFADPHVGDILFEVLQLTELGPVMAQQARGVACRHITQRCFGLLNESERGSNTFNRLWEGLARGVRSSSVPILIVSVACQTVASAEHMALLVETCLERHLELTRDPQGWKYVMRHLSVPELEAETFIRHCLGHALVLTLYAHILQKLDECEGNPDLRIMIGEQLGNWIVRTKMEAGEEGTEGKMVLLLRLYAQLLATELAGLPLPERHSRLRGHLPEIADVLFKWSEDRANQGIWATLGFGPRSRLSVKFRLFSRALGTFVAMRLLGTGEGREEQKAKLVGGVQGLQGNSEYSKVAEFVEPVVKFLEDEGNGLGSLVQFVERLGGMLFPEYHLMGMGNV
ncbi:Ectopic P granules protein 5 [Rhizophlyctis rosea]|uniref:Ectopic P granules protein 5 n=1 Tax=Rhizophlyctis rosea TaxID=64517 RepID=A0AAD5X021_9FUNG|nr:Ectopic P granules protein 5 [Rhizophlyctis rosea]